MIKKNTVKSTTFSKNNRQGHNSNNSRMVLLKIEIQLQIIKLSNNSKHNLNNLERINDHCLSYVVNK